MPVIAIFGPGVATAMVSSTCHLHLPALARQDERPASRVLPIPEELATLQEPAH